jgi:hypothetical protein
MEWSGQALRQYNNLGLLDKINNINLQEDV